MSLVELVAADKQVAALLEAQRLSLKVSEGTRGGCAAAGGASVQKDSKEEA